MIEIMRAPAKLSILVVCCLLTSPVVAQGKAAIITTTPPLALDVGSFGAFGYPQGSYAYRTGLPGYCAPGPLNTFGTFYSGTSLDVFALHQDRTRWDAEREREHALLKFLNEAAVRRLAEHQEQRRLEIEWSGRASVTRSIGQAIAEALAKIDSPQTAPTAPAPDTKEAKTTLPATGAVDGESYLARACYECHSGRRVEAGLNLEALAGLQPKQWTKIFTKLRTGDMPREGNHPATKRQATVEEIGAIYRLREDIRSPPSP